MQVKARFRMILAWLRRGGPLWAFLLTLSFVCTDAHLWAITLLSDGCNWPTTFLWAGAASQIFGLAPAAVLLSKAARISPEGAISARVRKWARGFVALFLPIRPVTGSAHITLDPATLTAHGYSVAAFKTGTIDQRVEQLEKGHNELRALITALQDAVATVERETAQRLGATSDQHRRQHARLRALLIELTASGIGWAYCGLCLIAVGVVLATFPASVPGFTCP